MSELNWFSKLRAISLIVVATGVFGTLVMLPQRALAAHEHCLGMKVGNQTRLNISHWVVTNRCGYKVKFKAYMKGTGGIYTVFTTPLGRMVQPSLGLPITVTLDPEEEQSFFFSSGGRPGSWRLMKDDIRKVS